MRKNVLPITAGVLGSLALAVSASADFVGWQMVNKGSYDTADAIFGGPDVGLVDVWNLYAVFNNPLDTVNAIFVIGGGAKEFNDMSTTTDLKSIGDGLGGGFWNWDPAEGQPLDDGFLWGQDSAAASADTFISIGLKAGFEGSNAAQWSSGAQDLWNDSGMLEGNGSIVDQDFAHFATGDDAQTFPDKDGRVLLFQVAVLAGRHASGSWNIQWGTLDPAGGEGVRERIDWTTIPAPGAMALLGLAGLAGARRRRRRG